MESDSDSSHISATPPRSQTPPPPRPSRLSSNKSRTRVNSSSAVQKSPPKPPQDESAPYLSPPVSTLPFQIRYLSVQNRLVSISPSIESLPAGYFSKSASFSKLNRPSLNFDPVETDPGRPISGDQNKTNAVKHHPNVIGPNAPLPPVKLRKCSSSEGNFVKLNMNRNKRKFTNRRNYNKSYRRSKRKWKAEGESVCSEDGFVTEIKKQEIKEDKAVEAAILAAKNEASDGNLVRLLNVMNGYDSFRDGQLEAIKMVLNGESSMVVLPTGAGKSLCYQIPAVILDGITLVVSPLVALMIDQLKHLPPVIQGGLLCSSQVVFF